MKKNNLKKVVIIMAVTKDKAIDMALELVKILLETKQLRLTAPDPAKNILDKLEALAKGIREIENKI